MSQNYSKKRQHNQIADDDNDGHMLFGGGSGEGADLEGFGHPENYEAMEDDNAIVDDIQDDLVADSDEGSGDDLMNDMERDYEARPELDIYENEGLDDGDHNELSMNQRMQVD